MSRGGSLVEEKRTYSKRVEKEEGRAVPVPVAVHPPTLQHSRWSRLCCCAPQEEGGCSVPVEVGGCWASDEEGGCLLFHAPPVASAAWSYLVQGWGLRGCRRDFLREEKKCQESTWTMKDKKW